MTLLVVQHVPTACAWRLEAGKLARRRRCLGEGPAVWQAPALLEHECWPFCGECLGRRLSGHMVHYYRCYGAVLGYEI